MGKRFTSTPDVPRVDGGVTLFRSCLVSAEYAIHGLKQGIVAHVAKITHHALPVRP